jgi:hypothetical protein
MEILLKLLSPLFKRQQTLAPIGDSTLYRVQTRTNTYCGRIMHQDEVVIRFQSNEGKPVKILKENIRNISIL